MTELPRGAYDLHVHCGPEPIPRRFDFLELSEHVAAAGMEAVAAKNHFCSTATWAVAAARHKHPNLLGSVTLNLSVGGICPDAIYAGLGMRAGDRPALSVVWMPTVHAKGHIDSMKRRGDLYDIPAEWSGGVQSPGSRLLEQLTPISLFDERTGGRLDEVLAVIADNGLVLCTGHLTGEEIRYLVPRAVKRGVERIVITHPLYQTCGLADEELAALTALDAVYAEQSYALMLLDHVPLEHVVRQIRRVGPAKTILTTDLGQCATPAPADGMAAYLRLLAEQSFSDSELEMMVRDNPQKLLRLG